MGALRSFLVKGKYGDAIHITNNGQDCVNIPSQEKLKVVDEITMTAWVYYQETWKGKKIHWIDKGCQGNFLAVSPTDKVATTWADLKTMSVYP